MQLLRYIECATHWLAIQSRPVTSIVAPDRLSPTRNITLPQTQITRIKEKVEEQSGVPPPQQRLIFSGRQMCGTLRCTQHVYLTLHELGSGWTIRQHATSISLLGLFSTSSLLCVGEHTSDYMHRNFRTRADNARCIDDIQFMIQMMR